MPPKRKLEQNTTVKKTSSHCADEVCIKRASFNFAGEKKPKYCKDHADPIMVDVRHKKCAKCDIRPNFNFPGQKGGILCEEHKENGMINVVSPLCVHPGCIVQPCFNFKGKKKGMFCKIHQTDGMINVVDKLCAEPNCETRPKFNFAGEKKGLFCFEHKNPIMIDVEHNICLKCDKRAYFNFAGEKRAIYCKDHQDTAMINVMKKQCQVCDSSVSFGIPGQTPTVCAHHKSSGMIRNPRRKCTVPKCKGFAQYGTIEPDHCEKHATEDEENLCLQTCKQCGSLEICNADQICFEYCINSDLFKRSKHKKELRVKCLLEAEIKQAMFSYDKSIDTACTKRRPDFVYDCDTHFVIVEVDENMHKYYDCEEKRMLEIVQSVGMPCIFIRYNPDKFDGAVVTNSEREKTLVTWVRKAIKSPPQNDNDDFIRLLYLFYDGHCDAKLSFEGFKASAFA